jgi:hypothetical protein
MKLAAFATLAVTLGTLTGTAVMSPAPAAASTNAPWCVSAPWQGGEFSCAYHSLTRCKIFAAPSDGGCMLNPKWQARIAQWRGGPVVYWR